MYDVKTLFKKENDACFVIAEAGVNHNKELNLARQMVAVAKDSAVDTVKFHAYKTDEIYIESAELPEYVKSNLKKVTSFYDMAKALELTMDELKDIKNYCDEKDILFSCTPYGNEGIKMMNNLESSFFKISSTHLTCIPFLKKLALENKPLILSTGMSNLEEVKSTVNIIEETKQGVDLAILHCTTNYPCPYKEANLNILNTYKKEFPNHIIGYSDHTKGITVPVIAVILGAKVVEKHFTLSRSMEGPDHAASLEPDELKLMMNAIRFFEKNKFDSIYDAIRELKKNFNPLELQNLTDDELCSLVDDILGSDIKQLTDAEKQIVSKARTSIVSAVAISKGSIITEEMLKYTRPGIGISPEDYLKVVGSKTNIDIPKNKILTLDNKIIAYLE